MGALGAQLGQPQVWWLAAWWRIARACGRSNTPRVCWLASAARLCAHHSLIRLLEPEPDSKGGKAFKCF